MARTRSQGSRKERASSLVGELPRYGVVIAAVVLAWQVVRIPIEDRAPAAMAIRLSPTSPLVLRRAAEEELAAGRIENARSLAADSLARDPFSARALRVLGLTYARTNDNRRADELLTLAGNWSLRDDPAHAWLVEYRLRQGDFASAFAHADTLARRRPDLNPQLFRLFVVAAESSPRGLTALAGLLARMPPWRDTFLEHLYGIPEGDTLLGSLALSLRSGEGRFNDTELAHLYLNWAGEGRTAGLKYLRSQLGRPPLDRLIQDGSFSGPPAPAPFAWVMAPAPGLTADITADETDNNNQALRVQFRGLDRNEVGYQLLLLEPGRYRLQGRIRVQEGSGVLPLAWTLACVESTEVLMDHPVVAPAENEERAWFSFDRTVVVPAARCTGQWLRLVTRPGDRRTTAVAWTDDLRLSRAD
ncbi:tetratricopeptide repeat protein [Brevundimonas sp.]|uniref:tetratricopeptide repeat protein n=1 Tax=Brevundimonas sp. TaxID=1871086 RepID=UPI002FCBB1FC